MTRVLVLRPEPGASETVERAGEHGLEAVSIPLFKIEPLAWTAPGVDSFDALLLTSANAVRHGGEGLDSLRALPVYAVGPATADAAREASFEIAGVGSADIDTLLATVDPKLRLLHLCGEHRRATSAPHAITSVPVYRSNALPRPAGLDRAGADVALIHSPRAGARLAELVEHRGSIALVAISAAAADAAGEGWASVHAADRPTDEALLALAARLCNKPAAK
ncbi:MAG TPA: uroporphyrinogen-III synthase [Sphingomicrobium sp.]|nr:uroporphyrinogen-III synthase [Sphingomicrobium sp.]